MKDSRKGDVRRERGAGARMEGKARLPSRAGILADASTLSSAISPFFHPFRAFPLYFPAVSADSLRMSNSSRPLLTFTLSTLCLASDIIGLAIFAGERHAFLFAGLLCLMLPFFMQSAVAVAETK